MAAGNTRLKPDCFEAVDPRKRESCHEFMWRGSTRVPRPRLGAQRAAQLGPRCGSHVMRSWETEDKRPMVGLLLGLMSVLQRFK